MLQKTGSSVFGTKTHSLGVVVGSRRRMEAWTEPLAHWHQFDSGHDTTISIGTFSPFVHSESMLS